MSDIFLGWFRASSFIIWNQWENLHLIFILLGFHWIVSVGFLDMTNLSLCQYCILFLNAFRRILFHTIQYKKCLYKNFPLNNEMKSLFNHIDRGKKKSLLYWLAEIISKLWYFKIISTEGICFTEGWTKGGRLNCSKTHIQ